MDPHTKRTLIIVLLIAGIAAALLVVALQAMEDAVVRRSTNASREGTVNTSVGDAEAPFGARPAIRQLPATPTNER